MREANSPLQPEIASAWHDFFSYLFSRVFRRRRRPRGTLASLLSDVTDSCQSWLDQKVFRGMFGTGHNRDRDQDLDLDLDLNWEPRRSKTAPLLEEMSWSPIKTTEVEETRDFTFGQ